MKGHYIKKKEIMPTLEISTVTVLSVQIIDLNYVDTIKSAVLVQIILLCRHT